MLSNSQREFQHGSVYYHGGSLSGKCERKNNRGVFENFVSDPSKKIILNNDNDENRRLFENCELKGKRIYNPIVDWLDRDVWEYIRNERLVINPLYEAGFYRVGCLGCPMAGKNRWTEFRLFPTFQWAYIRAFGKMLDRSMLVEGRRSGRRRRMCSRGGWKRSRLVCLICRSGKM